MDDQNNAQTTNTTPQEPKTDTAAQTTPTAPSGITFTQEELSAKLAKEKGTGERAILKMMGLESKDGLSEKAEQFKLFLEESKKRIEEAPVAEKLAALNGKYETLKSRSAKDAEELTMLRQERVLRSKGVSEDLLEFYAFKIGKLVTDDVSFEEAAAKFLQENPPKSAAQTPPPFSTGAGAGATAPAKKEFGFSFQEVRPRKT